MRPSPDAKISGSGCGVLAGGMSQTTRLPAAEGSGAVSPKCTGVPRRSAISRSSADLPMPAAASRTTIRSVRPSMASINASRGSVASAVSCIGPSIAEPMPREPEASASVHPAQARQRLFRLPALMHVRLDVFQVDVADLVHDRGDSGGSAAASAFERACAGLRAPGMTTVTASNIRIQRSANFAIVVSPAPAAGPARPRRGRLHKARRKRSRRRRRFRRCG